MSPRLVVAMHITFSLRPMTTFAEVPGARGIDDREAWEPRRDILQVHADIDRD